MRRETISCPGCHCAGDTHPCPALFIISGLGEWRQKGKGLLC